MSSVILLACTMFGTARVIGKEFLCLAWSCPNIVLQLVDSLGLGVSLSDLDPCREHWNVRDYGFGYDLGHHSSAGRPIAESRGGGTGERVGRGGRGRGPRGGCSYKEFLACNPKKYDGKGGVVVLTQLIEKIESVQDMSGCSIDQKVKYTASSFVGKALTWWNKSLSSYEMQKLETELWNHTLVGVSHAAYTDRFHELARLVPYLVIPESRNIKRYVYGLASQILRMVAATEPKTIQKDVQIFGALTDEAVRNGSIKKVKKRGNMGELTKDKNSGRHCLAHLQTVTRLQIEKAQGPGGNRPNQVVANNGGQGRGNQGNQARGIEPSELGFRYEIEIASGKLVEIDKVIKSCKLEIEGHVFDIDLIPFRHRSFDMIIGMDWLSNHKAKIIYHKKVVRIPLLDGKVLRVLGERPKEKARLLMIAKANEKETHKKEIGCLEDFSRAIPIAKSPYRLAPSELEELSGQLKKLQDKGFLASVMDTSLESPNIENLSVVREFADVFPDELPGLPPAREIEFGIELIPGAEPISKLVSYGTC
ncbi:putative reverse transcriptase domain-containing protein [Tanacetum coccineum]